MQYTVVVRCEEDVCPIRLRACVRYSSLIVSGMGPGSEMKVMEHCQIGCPSDKGHKALMPFVTLGIIGLVPGHTYM